MFFMFFSLPKNRIKTSEFTTNSSVLEMTENHDRPHGLPKGATIAKLPNTLSARSILRTPNRNNTTRGNPHSPHLSASAKKLKASNLGLII